MYKRRAIIKSVATAAIWTTPVIQAVFLPAHAQTSVCADNDVVGVWGFAIQSPAALGSENYTLDAGGSGSFNGEALSWQTSDNNLTITLSNGSTMNLQLFQNCNSASGTITEQGVTMYDVSGSLNGFAN